MPLQAPIAHALTLDLLIRLPNALSDLQIEPRHLQAAHYQIEESAVVAVALALSIPSF